MRTAYQTWLERLRTPGTGEDERQPSTWVLDDVWRAACVELTAAELSKDPTRRVPPDEVGKWLEHIRHEMRGIP